MRLSSFLNRAAPGLDDAEPRGTVVSGWATTRHEDSHNISALRTALNQLKRHRTPQFHDAKKAWLRSLDRRLAQPGLRWDERSSLRAELHVLDVETRIARASLGVGAMVRGWIKHHPQEHPGCNDDDLQRLSQARVGFANELLRQLDRGGSLDQALEAHLDALERSDPAAHAAALNALDAGRHLQDDRQQDACIEVAERLAVRAQRAQRSAEPSSAPRDAPRMPTDVLVHLASVIADVARRHPGDAALDRISGDARRLFTTHGATLATVRGLAATAAGRLAQLGEHAQARRCFQLAQQLPRRAQQDGATALNRQQLHENLYGRVFDSQWMANLVDHPPVGVLSAVKDVGAAYTTRLAEGSVVAERASLALRQMLLDHQRPWMNAVPALRPLLLAGDGPSSRRALVDYLRSPVVDGHDAVARTYLMVWAGNAYRDAAKAAGEEHLIPAATLASDANYSRVITKQALRDRSTTLLMARGVGIHLPHQPAPVDPLPLTPAWRSAAVYRVGKTVAGKPGEVGATEFSRSLDIQHERALPVGSGVSGSTNLLMHAFAGLRDAGLHNASARDFLLAAGMMLNYDGGHSLHEALWVGNQLDRTLNLGLGLDDTGSPPQEFVSDYAAFADGFPPQTRERLREAMDQAWTGTQAYLKQHSHFAKDDA